MLQKIVYAGSNNPSFQRASQDLLVLAEVTVPVKQVERLTERIGQERLAEREATTAAYLARPLTQREDAPPGTTAPPLAVVEMDGGRLQIRAAPPEVEAATAPPAQPSPPWPVISTGPSQPRNPTAKPNDLRRPNTGVKTRSAACWP